MTSSAPRRFALACAAALVPFFAACGPVAVAPDAKLPPVVVVPPSVTAAPADTQSAAPASVCIDPPGPRPSVLNPEDDWPSQNLFAGREDTTPPVDKACKKALSARPRALKKATGATDDALGDLGRCKPSPRGAWVLDMGEAKDLKPDAQHTFGGWQIGYALSYVTPEGKLVRSADVAGAVSFRDDEQHDVTLLAVFDFDGDGVSEVVLSETENYGGEEHSEKISVRTFKNGAVVAYAPAEKISIDRVLDVDGDLRPDFVIPGAFKVEGPCGLDGQSFRGPPQVAHSLPDGTFSINDAVAAEVIRKECGTAERVLLAVSRDSDGAAVDAAASARRITCARIYGASEPDVLHRIREKYPFPHKKDDSENEEPGSAGYCMPLRLMLELGKQVPDFTTQPPCPQE